MKYLWMSCGFALLLLSCGENSTAENVTVANMQELTDAIGRSAPGTEIVLANGVWEDARINFYGMGTEEAPITLRAETPGEVYLEGQSYLHLGGEHLVVSGLHFRNGYTPEGGVIQYRIGRDTTAFHTRVTDCVIDGFTQPNRYDSDTWIEFYGKHNQLDHCYIAGKSNDGATLMVYHAGNEHTDNHHQIVNNYFGPRPRKGGPRGETIRLGGSETSMTPGRVNVSNNYFEACNGEVEIISDKTNFNFFTHNIFDKCEGSLVMRHANYTTVDGNIFIGGDDSDFYGGVRVVNTGHWITNNYFYKIRGEQFRSPLAIMNGIPKSSLNRYKQVTDVVVAHNTWIDSRSPWQIGVGQNMASADVLPESEIRSAPPIRTTIANNLVYNTEVDTLPVFNHDDITGVRFQNNLIDNHGTAYTEYEGIRSADIEMKQVNDWLLVPADGQDELLNEVYAGFDFDRIKTDLFGNSRGEKNRIGAISDLAAAADFRIDKSQYGPSWYSTEKVAAEPTVHQASPAAGELANLIGQAAAGDVIELGEGEYSLDASLRIDKKITLRAASPGDVRLVYTGADNTPALEMHPGGDIRLENLHLSGGDNQLAFAPLDEGMASAYKLSVDNCEIENFGHVLLASRGSFADSLRFTNTTIRNCANGFVLAADEKGDYNAEMVTFEGCTFDGVRSNVIDFYRGGYDESTIGGQLTLTGNTFTGCGAGEGSGVLIRTRGIINVHLVGNTFRDNPVELVALLWGEKNNHHRDNTVIRSGRIEVEQQQELELLY
ncbi:poly(beta-D-mannuronate) lyase [Lewinella aquimaris]|uniref:Poly(Beta-D-mannuronate) lyase n=1 Tax=Neolewinella aquimaris TaxID=1835722 RepID=A0A840E6Q8_9BACT|nr:chondroitinase-B domain-containing protein [Neolewinella aquimaris]MBB4080730.1 poly(beta-D-mannuronate) lyase [Neolewinella aquimaris]